MFSYNPTILPLNPVSQDSSTAENILYAYSEKCKLDVCIHIFCKYYVGHNIVYNSLSTQDVCRRISYLKQEWRDRNGCTVCEITGYLFNEFLHLSISLHESACQWLIQIWSVYYTELIEDLVNKMVSEKTFMPSLIALDIKEKKLASLQVVRENASEQYRELEEEE